MRRTFGQCLYEQMQKNDQIFLITGDLGYGLFDRHRLDFGNRFINTGAAEQTMMGVAVGLALEGKIPFVYSITPFLLYRPFETIRNYINHEKIPVKMIGSGRDKDYSHDGPSHWAEDDRRVMSNWPHINAYWPVQNEVIGDLVEKAVNHKEPYYINLKR